MSSIYFPRFQIILPNSQEQLWKSHNTTNCRVLYNNWILMDWSNKLGKWNRLMYEAAADSFSCNASAANFWLQSQTQKKVSSHFLPASFKTWMGKGSLFVASLNISHRSPEEYPPFCRTCFRLVWKNCGIDFILSAKNPGPKKVFCRKCPDVFVPPLRLYSLLNSHFQKVFIKLLRSKSRTQSQLVWSFESQGVSKILRACRNFGKVNG